MARRNPFMPYVSNLVRRHLKRSGSMPSVDFLSTVWPALVGSLADRTCPLTLSQGHLTIAVSSELWLKQVESQKARLLKGLNEALPEPLVGLRFVLAPSGIIPDAGEGALSNQAPPKLGELPEDEAALMSEEIQDPELRDLVGRVRRLSLGQTLHLGPKPDTPSE